MNLLAKEHGRRTTMEPIDLVLDGGATAKIHSDVVWMAVIFLIVLVVFIFLLYRFNKYCLSSPTPRIGFDAPDVLGSSAGRCGLSSAVLRSLPITVYRAAGSEGGRLECAVCLFELKDGEEARVLPKCGHGFHLECIDMWFVSHGTCPLCRSTIAAEPASSDRNPAAEATETPPQSETAPESATADVAGALALIEIPRSELEWFPSPPEEEEELKTQISPRLMLLRRCWSMGEQRGDIEQGLGGGSEGSALPPTSPSSS